MINEFFWDNISKMSPFYPYDFPSPVRGAKPSSKKKLNDKMTIASLAWFNDLAENLQTPMGGICETITDITTFPGITDALLGIPSTERYALMQMKLKLISVPQPPPKVCNLCSLKGISGLEHFFSSCSFAPFRQKRIELQSLILAEHPNLMNDWNLLSPSDRMLIMVGQDWDGPKVLKEEILHLSAGFLISTLPYLE